MQWVTALFLTVLSLLPFSSSAQESIQDWSKKVVELQEKEGQNFEQDLQLVKGFLYLQRRADALAVLNRLLKPGNKKDPRLSELFETASTQFFLQDTAELYSDVVQLIQEESWAEAKEKTEAGLQKESRHRLLTLREIQLGLVLGQLDPIADAIKVAESTYSENTEWKVYSAWISLSKNDAKEAYRILSGLWTNDKKLFEKSEVAMLAFLQAIELSKRTSDRAAEWVQLSRLIQKHPEWVGVRVWRLKNKSFAEADRKKEITQLKEQFLDIKKLKSQREKQEKECSYFYSGIISVEKTKALFDEYIAQSLTK